MVYYRGYIMLCYYRYQTLQPGSGTKKKSQNKLKAEIEIPKAMFYLQQQERHRITQKFDI